MRRFLVGIFAFLFFSIIILPSMLVRGFDWSAAVPPESSPESKTEGPLVRVFRMQGQELVEMPLEEYLVGAVAAEMPAEFELEALKAQAIAARTFTLYRMSLAGGSGCERDGHTADICTDPSHCQGWLSPGELYEKWGANYTRFLAKISRAVDETAGMVITYNDQLVDASYHSTCGGHTEDAAAVWGKDVPYLVGVPCPYDVASPRFKDELSLSLAQVAGMLNTPVVVAVAGGRGTKVDLEVLKRSSSGRVMEIRVGKEIFTGGEFRQLLGLRSTNFDWRLEGDNLTFETLGYGHGVGMCQYGANGMAKEGETFNDILRYYYRGVEVKSLAWDES
jgi:stage II sporulation protein D